MDQKCLIILLDNEFFSPRGAVEADFAEVFQLRVFRQQNIERDAVVGRDDLRVIDHRAEPRRQFAPGIAVFDLQTVDRMVFFAVIADDDPPVFFGIHRNRLHRFVLQKHRHDFISDDQIIETGIVIGIDRNGIERNRSPRLPFYLRTRVFVFMLFMRIDGDAAGHRETERENKNCF